MNKILTVIVSIFIVIDVVITTPLNDEVTTQQTLKKRDVSTLKQFKQLRQDNGVVYRNNVPGNEATILSQVFTVAPNDNYYFAYKQSDLQEREETGVYEYDEEKRKRVLKVKGFYEYIRPDGVKQRVEYTADDKGFHPFVIEP